MDICKRMRPETREKLKKVKELLKQGYSLTKACKTVRIHFTTVYRYRICDEELKQLVEARRNPLEKIKELFRARYKHQHS